MDQSSESQLHLDHLEDDDIISVSELSSSMLLLAGGISIALVVFILEKLFKSYNKFNND